MLNAVQKMTDRVMNVFLFAACVYMVGVVVACSLQVFSRYVMNSSIPWTEEVARYAFICMGMLGTPAALLRGQHVKIDVVENILGEKGKLVQRFVVDLAMIFISAVFFYQGSRLMISTWGLKGTAVPVPVAVVYYSVPLCGLGCLWVSLVDILRLLTNQDGKEQSS